MLRPASILGVPYRARWLGFQDENSPSSPHPLTSPTSHSLNLLHAVANPLCRRIPHADYKAAHTLLSYSTSPLPLHLLLPGLRPLPTLPTSCSSTSSSPLLFLSPTPEQWKRVSTSSQLLKQRSLTLRPRAAAIFLTKDAVHLLFGTPNI